MDWLNIITAATVLIIHLAAVGFMIYRYRATNNTALVGTICAFLILTVGYGFFTYNAITNQSNAPLRYLLRLGNGAIAVSIITLAYSHHRMERIVRARFEAKLRELDNELRGVDG